MEVAGRAAGGDAVRLDVVDAGSAVDAGALAHAFEPLTRLDRPDAEPTPGHGLGLAIVRTLVANCGGQVTPGAAAR